jgi:hypothetical protein
LGFAFRNHLAGRVAYILYTLFAYDAAGGVGASLAAAFGNHLAGRVGANLGAWFANHSANGVGASLGLALRHHFAGGVTNRSATWFANDFASCVGAGLAAAFGNHLANRVGASLGSAFWNHFANGVRYNLFANFLFISNAIDYAIFTVRNPNFLGDRLGWALYAFYSGFTWAVYVSASCRIKNPFTWFANRAANDWTSDFFSRCFPLARVNFDRTSIVNRFGGGV